VRNFNTTVNLLLLGIFISCSPSANREGTGGLEPIPLSYAKGFEIFQGNGYKVIEVMQAFSGEHDPYRYLVAEKENVEFEESAYDAVILLPVKSIILTSTTQVPHLDLLGISDLLIGFPDTDLISSGVMRKHIAQKKVTDLGTGAKANIELMIGLNPDLIMVSTLGDNLQQFSLLKKAGIPAVINGEYTEQDPLGRAEWIKFTGALTGKYVESVEVFKEIEAAYLSLKEKISAASPSRSPSVISGVMYKDIWYAPAGGNWGALFLEDAGSEYIFKEESGTGSLQLNYEYVLDKALEADFWIGAADFKNLETMGETDPRYTQFKAYKNGQVYTYTHQRGATGGIEYFELGYMRPDIILKDLVKIFHPELLPDYEPYFYKQLN
jgi:iron complex transport system substrate-binding protein